MLVEFEVGPACTDPFSCLVTLSSRPCSSNLSCYISFSLHGNKIYDRFLSITKLQNMNPNWSETETETLPRPPFGSHVDVQYVIIRLWCCPRKGSFFPQGKVIIHFILRLRFHLCSATWKYRMLILITVSSPSQEVTSQMMLGCPPLGMWAQLNPSPATAQPAAQHQLQPELFAVPPAPSASLTSALQPKGTDGWRKLGTSH